MNKMLVVLAIALILVVGVLSVGLTSTGLFAMQNNDDVRIGVVGTITGFGSFFGQQQVRGLEIALEEINSSGGINGKKVQLIIEDSKTTPADSVTATRKLIDFDGVNFIVGDSWNSNVVAMKEVTNAEGVIAISPIAVLDGFSQDDFFFRTVSTTRDMMKVLADYAYNKLGARKVAFLVCSNSYCVEHADDFAIEFESLGGEIVAYETFVLSQTDVRTEIAKVKAHNPDTVLMMHGSGPMNGELLTQAKELGFKVNWLAPSGIQNDTLLESHSAIAEGLVYPYNFDHFSGSPAVKEFVYKYKEKYGEIPDYVAANSYDALMLLAEAIGEVGEDPIKVKEYLLSVENYGGASGILSFDENGDVEKPIVIKTIKNGEFVLVE